MKLILVVDSQSSLGNGSVWLAWFTYFVIALKYTVVCKLAFSLFVTPLSFSLLNVTTDFFRWNLTRSLPFYEYIIPKNRPKSSSFRCLIYGITHQAIVLESC